MKNFLISILLSLAGLNLVSSEIVLCYFGSWSTYRYGQGHFDVEDIDPFLCTHLIFGFAGVEEGTHEIKVLDPYNELYDNWGKGAFDRFTNLKRHNPNLKCLLAVGGWNEGATKYARMAQTAETRKAFIDSATQLVLDHNFDGLDMDWEYPVGRADSPGLPEDYVNFPILLKELRAAMDEHGLLLTAAVSAGESTVVKAYDIPEVAKYLDLINVMTYDYHGWFDAPESPYTAHQSPLYPLPYEEEDEDHFNHNLNVEWSINYWIDNGARRDQLLIGVGTYGRGFRLADPNNHGYQALASGPSNAGPYTQENGVMGYNEYCEKIKPTFTTVREDLIVAPYAYSGDQWFSYDDIESARIKTEFAQSLGLAGVFVWSVDTDDFRNICGDGVSPIITEIARVLNNGPMTLPPDYTEPPTTTTEDSNSGPFPAPDGVCDGIHHLVPDPEDCHGYYSCTPNADNGWDVVPGQCIEGLVFVVGIQGCDYEELHPEIDCDEQQETTAAGGTDPQGTTAAGGTDPQGSTAAPTTQDNNPTTNSDDICNGEGGFYPIEGECVKFIECVPNGDDYTPVEKECAPGTVFNPDIGACDFPGNVEGCEDTWDQV